MNIRITGGSIKERKTKLAHLDLVSARSNFEWGLFTNKILKVSNSPVGEIFRVNLMGRSLAQQSKGSCSKLAATAGSFPFQNKLWEDIFF